MAEGVGRAAVEGGVDGRREDVVAGEGVVGGGGEGTVEGGRGGARRVVVVVVVVGGGGGVVGVFAGLVGGGIRGEAVLQVVAREGEGGGG